MCFSAEADLVAGVVVGGAGIDALRHVRDRREIAFAALPLIFGVHQAIEAFNWWGLEDRVPAALGEAAMWAYLVIAFLLPAFVPLAIRSIEPDPLRRRMTVPFALLGAIVSVILLMEVFSGPVTSEVAGRYIEYGVTLKYGGQVTALYVIATSVPLLLSSRKTIVVFGILNLAAVTVLAWLMATGVISLWCAWAAVTSIMIVLHLRKAETNRLSDDRD